MSYLQKPYEDLKLIYQLVTIYWKNDFHNEFYRVTPVTLFAADFDLSSPEFDRFMLVL